MKILELHAENVKRLKVIEIKPDGSPIVTIGGANGAGKSSILDSIMYALAGKGSLPPKPVREGADEATIRIDLGKYVVTRTIAPDGSSAIKVIGKDGGRMASPQAILDGLVGNLSFDPLAFSRMEPRKQVDQLKRLVGLDFTSLDQEKAAKYEERLLVGREVATLQGQLKGLPRHEGVAVEETSIATATKQLEEARIVNQENSRLRRQAEADNQSLTAWVNRVDSLKKELEAAKDQVAMATEGYELSYAAATACVDKDESAIIASMSNAETMNRKIRENKNRMRVAQQLDQKEVAYKALTEYIREIDAEKADVLASATFPIPNLSFDESGLVVNGQPFQQASSAEQLRVSVAMGLAINPELRVILVRDGSLLDETSMGILFEMAEKADAQVWVERVSTGEECTVVIEAGEVRGGGK